MGGGWGASQYSNILIFGLGSKTKKKHKKFGGVGANNKVCAGLGVGRNKGAKTTIPRVTGRPKKTLKKTESYGAKKKRRTDRRT